MIFIRVVVAVVVIMIIIGMLQDSNEHVSKGVFHLDIHGVEAKARNTCGGENQGGLYHSRRLTIGDDRSLVCQKDHGCCLVVVLVVSSTFQRGGSRMKETVVFVRVLCQQRNEGCHTIV